MPILNDITVSRATVSLTFDDRSQLRLRKSDWAALPLNQGDEVNLPSYEGRVCARQSPEAYESALSLLDYSARTENEIRKKLALKGFLPAVLDAVIERLKQAHLIDDNEYAHRMLESPAARQKGVYALKRKLQSKGISQADVEDALSSITDEDQTAAALAAAQSLSRKYGALDPRARRAKLSQALARRGFSWDTISEALTRLETDEDE